jgi:hypothetical protein
VVDGALALCKDLIKSLSQKQLTNYRLSRARRVIKNTFGVMASRFGVFHTEINLKLERIETVVLCFCVLHNFLRRCCNLYAAYIQDECGEEQSDILTPLQRGHKRYAGEEGRAVREKFVGYFNEEGKILWQNRIVCYVMKYCIMHIIL